MVNQLLWILSIYLLAVALVHLLHAWHVRKVKQGYSRRIHYILVTSNHEQQIEWYLRALGLHAFLTGKHIRVTVLDEQSRDQTLEIIRKMDDSAGVDISIVPKLQLTTDDIAISGVALGNGSITTVVDLRNPNEARRIPYV